MLQGGTTGGGMSSDDFVQFMEGLQDQRNVVVDLSKSVSTGTYYDNNKSVLEYMYLVHNNYLPFVQFCLSETSQMLLPTTGTLRRLKQRILPSV